MNASNLRTQFRALLSGTSCVRPASVSSPLSARIAMDIGFEAAMLAGSLAALEVLGDANLSLITLTEFATLTRSISRAADLPLLVDADNGFGNALNVMRTVEELEHAGAAAIAIEDTLLPRPYAAKGAKQLISIEEGLGKMRAALEARTDPALVIVARTCAASFTTVDDAIARCKAYEAAGVDAIHLASIKKRGDLEAVAAELHVPLMLGSAWSEPENVGYLFGKGVRMVLPGHQAFFAAVRATHLSMSDMRAGIAPRQPDARELVNRLNRTQLLERWSEEFL